MPGRKKSVASTSKPLVPQPVQTHPPSKAPKEVVPTIAKQYTLRSRQNIAKGNYRTSKNTLKIHHILCFLYFIKQQPHQLPSNPKECYKENNSIIGRGKNAQ